MIKDVEIHPLRLELGRPDMFELMTEATEGAWVVVPANAFRGWSVSIDGDAPVEAKSLDGYVAFPAAPGKHSYHFEYHFPYLTMVLVLSALPWIVGIWVIFTLLNRTKCGGFRF